MLGVAVVGVGDADQLHLAELVLAQHAARVAPGAAGLAAEAVGERAEPHRQRALGQHLVPHQVGQRHLGRGDQPTVVLRAEQVVLKLRQLAGAEDRRAVDEGWDADFFVAVLPGVHVEHQLTERAFQTGKRPAQHGKSAAGDLGRALEIHQAKRFAKLEMLFRHEGEFVRRAPTFYLDIAGLVRTVRHANIQDIRQPIYIRL